MSAVVETLDTDAFARACSVKPETVRRWVRRGQLVPYGRTFGGHLRFLPSQAGEVLRVAPAPMTERARDIEAHVRSARAELKARLRSLDGKKSAS